MMNDKLADLIEAGTSLLQELIRIPSFSREENGTADLLCHFLQQRGVEVHRYGNNVWAYNKYKDDLKPCVLLNSHHDTVKPNAGYTKDPFEPILEDGKLFGLGSNDAGGCLVALISAFLYFYDQEDLAYNICFLASAEEEVSGKNGIEEAYKHIGEMSFAIVGEPTLLDLAVAEKGLMVLDCTVRGVSGHAARDEGENAIYKAMEAIEWFKRFEFPKESTHLGPVKMSVTLVQAGTQHNVVPDVCTFVVDVRTTDVYSNLEVLEMIKAHVEVHVDVAPRSTRLNPSSIDLLHPIVLSGLALGARTYGSPTMSDQALLPIPSIKVGPGDSSRSHTADEFIYLKEIDKGVRFYVELLKKII